MRTRFGVYLTVFLSLVLSGCLNFFGCDNESVYLPTYGPEPPYNPYPYHLAVGMSRTPHFSWDCYDPNDHEFEFTLELQKNDASGVLYTGETGDFHHQYPDTLSENTEYLWRVKAKDNDGHSNHSDWWLFTTGTGFNNPPAAPYDFSPVCAALDQPLELTLEWKCHDPDGDPLSYDVWFYESGQTPVKVSERQTDTFYAVSGLSQSIQYNWVVTAFDSKGDSSSGHCNFVTVRNASPDPPSNPYPVDGATGISVDVTLSWSCSHPEGSPLVYDVYFGPDAGTAAQISTDQSETFLSVTGLEQDTKYKWKIFARDTEGDVTPGPVWYFTTAGPPPPPGDVYAELIFGRRQNFSDFDSTLTRIDMISARFDSAYAPDGPIKPLQAASVYCGTPAGYDIPWNAGMHEHYYDNPYAGYFLAPGAVYTYTVEEGGGVPALTESILYPECRPYITSPAGFSSVPRTGFELQWTHYCGGTVAITIMDLNADSTGVYFFTEDDGSYTFTADDLAVLDPMTYQIQVVLITQNRRNIVAPGYDPRSFIWARTLATQILYLQ
jgi:hypothetical protein